MPDHVRIAAIGDTHLTRAEFHPAPPAGEAADQAIPGTAQRFHSASPSSAKKRAMISVACRHWCFSDCRAFLPALVML